MLNRIIRRVVLTLLWLRYRIRIVGLDEVERRGRGGILFLPNHPALIDPVILMAVLLDRFAPRALADKDQVDRFFIRWLARRVGVRPIPDMARYGLESRHKIADMLAESIDGLRGGQNMLMYPAGHIKTSRVEDLGGNSAVEEILRGAPDVRVVLVRTTGLWGSSFSRASGRPLDMANVVLKNALRVLANFLFFTPRREVTITFHEPADLPRGTDRSTINRYLERFYNAQAPPAAYVPYTIYDRRGVRQLPEPAGGRGGESTGNVPDSVRAVVADHLREVSGRQEIRDSDNLAGGLGLDSLARAELAVWIEQEFGIAVPSGESLQTAADVMLASCGLAAGAEVTIAPPPRKWFAQAGRSRNGGRHRQTAAEPVPVFLPDGDTITAVFLAQARRRPSRPIIADPMRGMLTYRRMLAGIHALAPIFRRMEGQYLGIMLPAGTTAATVYFSALFAGKTPVMVNWTTGPRNVQHSLESLGVRKVITAQALVSRLSGQSGRQGHPPGPAIAGKEQGTGTRRGESQSTSPQPSDWSALGDRFVMLERLGKTIGPLARLKAAVLSLVGWGRLRRCTVSPTAAVLFTSGSEATPKAVPLTHANMLTNIRDVLSRIDVFGSDCMLGMLPPFHSFGLTVTTVLPACLGVRACYYPNPTEGAALAGVIAAYGATLAIGTPTFLEGIARASAQGQMASLRLAVTGAEKCPPRVYDLLSARSDKLTVLEGYGITECSPIVAVNDARAPRRGTVGRVLPSFQYAIVDIEGAPAGADDGGPRVPAGTRGMLLLRGPCIFGGYLNYDGPSPLVRFDGRDWYRTGDLVSQDEQGVLTFHGRLKRFAKIGGEMVSLPAIEAVLDARFTPPDRPADEGPALAVEACGQEHAELVLFTVGGISRQQANETIQQAGLSGLHNIRRVVRMDALPVLGTGKTDYRALRETERPETSDQ